ncbi:uncharacterized protein BXZ73DRAFT_53681, partial [Epithele typhae]|uniref:uncharacterized protein n=1 Tax=Epithele typhae TaxID=378194 RepID=UPI0020078FE2
PRRSAVPATNNGVKRGLSFNDASLLKGFTSGQVKHKASWAYNWASSTSSLPSGMNFFPMLWGSSSDHTSVWMKNAQAAIDAGSTHLLFLNEPDLSSQSNVDPATAAKLWMQYMQPFAGKATLVSPAITNSGSSGQGTSWMDSFISQCNKLGCQVDAIAAHIYSDASAVDYFKSYISGLSKYGKPVLMTEIGTSSGSASQQAALVDELVPFLDGLDSVSHYAWFMAGPGFLVNNDGSLTSLGQTYQSA